MSHLAPKRLPLALPLLLAALVAPAAAHGNGFALDIQGAFSNGTATAGAASAHDPAGQFANPAVLASLEGTQLVLGGMLIAGRAPYTDGGSTLLGGAMPLPGANGDGAQAGTVPWVFASHRLSPSLAVGFQLAAPFGLTSDYGKSKGFYGRYQGVESVIESVAFGPTVAWRPTSSLAVGAGLSARRDHALIGQAADIGSLCVAQRMELGESADEAVANCTADGMPPGGADGYAKFDANGWAWTLTLGVTFEPVAGTRLGLGYRHEAQGEVEGDAKPDAALAAATGFAGDTAASMKLPLPDFFTLSLEQKVGAALTLHAAFQYSLWSRWDTITLTPEDPANPVGGDSQQGFRSVFRVSGGAAYAVSPGLELFGGVAFEQSPITDRYRQATLPERDSLIAGLGAQLALGRVTLGAVYQRVQMLGESKIDQDTGSDHLVGSVEGSANVAALQLGWRG